MWSGLLQTYAATLRLCWWSGVHGGRAASLSLCVWTGTPTLVTDTQRCACLILLVDVGCLRESRASNDGLQMHRAYMAMCLLLLAAGRNLLVAAPWRWMRICWFSLPTLAACRTWPFGGSTQQTEADLLVLLAYAGHTEERAFQWLLKLLKPISCLSVRISSSLCLLIFFVYQSYGTLSSAWRYWKE